MPRFFVGLGVLQLGDPPPRFHDLRHTCLSLLLADGAPPHLVQQIVRYTAHRRDHEHLCARVAGREAGHVSPRELSA
jgi:integrase